jgi:hypothetical protein
MTTPPADRPVLQPTPAAQPMRPAWRDVVDNPWLMVAMLFLVTAALGLPFLWISRGFSWLGKCLLTIAVLAWTALVLWLFWLVMAWCVPRIWDGMREIFSA